MKNAKIKFMTFAFAMSFAVVGAFAAINNNDVSEETGFAREGTDPCAITTQCSTIEQAQKCFVGPLQYFGKKAGETVTCTKTLYKL